MLNVDLNALLTEAVGDEEQIAAEAVAEYDEEVKDLLKRIVLKVAKAYSAEGDVRPALQAILDGSGVVSAPAAPSSESPEECQQLKTRIADLETEVTTVRRNYETLEQEKAQLAAEKESLEGNLQQLRTDKGRVDTELRETKAKLERAEADLANARQQPQQRQTSVSAPAPARPVKKAAAPQTARRPQGFLDRAKERGKRALGNLD